MTVEQRDEARRGKRVSVREIQAAVCRHYGVASIEMVSERRGDAMIHRHMAMYLSRVLTPLSLPAIGRQFGGRDHSTVLYAIRRTEERMAEDRAFTAAIGELMAQLTDPEQKSLPLGQA